MKKSIKNNSRKHKTNAVKKMSKKINKYKQPIKSDYITTRKHRVFLKNLTNKLGNKPKYSKRKRKPKKV